MLLYINRETVFWNDLRETKIGSSVCVRESEREHGNSNMQQAKMMEFCIWTLNQNCISVQTVRQNTSIENLSIACVYTIIQRRKKSEIWFEVSTPTFYVRIKFWTKSGDRVSVWACASTRERLSEHNDSKTKRNRWMKFGTWLFHQTWISTKFSVTDNCFKVCS